jgi:hypothetical protein
MIEFKWIQRRQAAPINMLCCLRITAQAYQNCVAAIEKGLAQAEAKMADDPDQAVSEMSEFNFTLVGINIFADAIEKLSGLAPGELRGGK